ncbi:MAG: bifunctional phosphopantothenoylcysteine decarboxylase/phosphopantothenate--cysteine ligase CoaBC, partial [Synergistaceae bacterium]|nr:bifunctional phosphopantothenoylcysteine decarboxylase/phosphopantothenate--cysteine ligase CoaBC [Synergistaceae bacterium]
VHMLNPPSTARNLEILKEMGMTVSEPETGSLACGYEGKGRLPAVDAILDEMWRAICPFKTLEGRNILVTAGPTWEFLDPVRFISNPSTGKMGYAMARTAWYRGGSVSFVHGPCSFGNLAGFSVYPVVSAEEMKRTVLSLADEMDYVVKAAAVGDYRAASFSERKIKREKEDILRLELVQNTDIAAALGERKKKGQILVGFAAESHDLVENASGKMKRKNLDFIAANDITGTDTGFGSDTNEVKLLGVDGTISEFSGTKDDVAEGIWNRILGEDLPR